MTTSERLTSLLALKTSPVALAFSDDPPVGVAHVDERAPAGCAYWSRAAKGESFYTLPGDHAGCAVGAHTHNAPLDEKGQAELGELIKVMSGLGYLGPDEVPQIATRKTPLKVLTYSPLDGAVGTPDLVLIRASARSGMLLSEAAHLAGVRDDAAAGLRPACTVVPHTQSSGKTSSSLGCIGNRVYTGLGDDELWFAIPGAQLDKVLDKLETVVTANRALESFHRARLPQKNA